MQHHLDHAVHLILRHKAAQVVKTRRVGRHDGAVDLQVAFRQSTVRVTRLIHHELLRPGPGTVVRTDVVRPHLLQAADGLLPYARRGAACDEHAGPAPGVLPNAAFELPRDVLDLLHQVVVSEVEVHGLRHGADLVAGDRRRLGLCHLVEPHKGPPDAVAVDNGVVQFLLRDLHVEELFQKTRRRVHLLRPGVQSHRLIPSLGQVQDMHGLKGVHELVHLLLAVAGRLGQDAVGEEKVRALIRHRHAVAGLDQRAQRPGQHGLRLGDALLALAAEPHGDGPGGADQLRGRVGTEGPDDLLAPLLRLVERHERGLAFFVKRLKIFGQ